MMTVSYPDGDTITTGYRHHPGRIPSPSWIALFSLLYQTHANKDYEILVLTQPPYQSNNKNRREMLPDFRPIVFPFCFT